MNVDSLGFIELPNLCDAVEALDIMLKRSDVRFVTSEKKLGGCLVTIVVGGEVAAVTEAVDAAKASASGRIVASMVIANPHPETWRMVRLSMKKYE